MRVVVYMLLLAVVLVALLVALLVLLVTPLVVRHRDVLLVQQHQIGIRTVPKSERCFGY